MKKLCVILILLTFMPLLTKVVEIEKKENFAPVVPYLEIARNAILENDILNAVKILKKAKQCYKLHAEACGFIYADYMQLVGIIYMESRKFEKAEYALNEVLKEYPERTILFLYLGESLFHQKRFNKAAEAFEKGYDKGKSMPSFFVFKSEAEKRAGYSKKALETLRMGLNIFNNNKELLKCAVLIYAENELFKTAIRIHNLYLEKSNYDISLYLYLSDIIQRKGDIKSAGLLLEEANIVNPYNKQILERLASIYAEIGNTYTSARILKKLSVIRPDSAFNSAEQFRLAGNFDEALRMNSKILNPERRIKQKFMTYLSKKSFVKAFLLAEKLEKYYSDNEEIIYKLIYSAIKSEQFDEAKRIIKKLKSEPYRKAGEEFSLIINQCKQEPALCR